MLAPHIAGSVFLDLYAGSGAVGIEAASRGAAEVLFAETDRAALTALRSNLQQLGIRSQVESGGTATLLKRLIATGKQAGIIFLDPPYEAAEEYDRTLVLLGSSSLVASDGVVVAEHRSRTALPLRIGHLESYRTLKQGDAALTFYRRSEPAAEPATE